MDTLILGNGNRARNTIIPALKEIEGEIFIHGRDSEKVEAFCKATGCSHLSSLRNLPKSISRLCIAIPSNEAYEYLLRIDDKFSKNIVLFLDTPFFGGFKNVKLLKLQNKFKKTLVTEDWISKPAFSIVKKIAQDENLGDLNEITFQNSGFSYHSLAISRKIYRRALSFGYKKGNNYFFNFSGKKMKIINPKDYDNCSTIFKFQRGVVKDISGSYETPKKGEIIVQRTLEEKKITYTYTTNETKDIEIQSIGHSIKTELNHYENIEKILSLKIKFVNQEEDYSFIDGAYDSLVFAILNRLNIFFDICFNKTSVALKLLKSYGKSK